MELVTLSDVETREKRWLWRGRVPLGSVTTIGAKHEPEAWALANEISDIVKTGRAWPDGTENGPRQYMHANPRTRKIRDGISLVLANWVKPKHRAKLVLWAMDHDVAVITCTRANEIDWLPGPAAMFYDRGILYGRCNYAPPPDPLKIDLSRWM